MNDYEDAWADNGPGEAPAPKTTPAAPAENAVQAAARTQGDEQAKQFADAFHGEAPAATDAPAEVKPEPKNFREAFKAARSEGLKEFEWNGKKYTTKVKAKAAPATVAPAAPVVAAPAPTKSRLAILNAMRAKDAAIKGVKA